MFQVLKDFVKVFTWEEPEMLDWIELELGEAWYGGTVYVRISMIQAVTKSPSTEGESIVYTGDNGFDVKGTPEEIMEMINART